jgi:hypothetical protein
VAAAKSGLKVINRGSKPQINNPFKIKYRFQGPGFRDQVSGVRIQGSGFRGQDSGFRYQKKLLLITGN